MANAISPPVGVVVYGASLLQQTSARGRWSAGCLEQTIEAVVLPTGNGFPFPAYAPVAPANADPSHFSSSV